MLFEYKGYQIPVDLLNMTGGGAETFGEISEAHIAYLKDKVGFSATDRFLEVGCGIGRDAIPLTRLLSPTGSYLGIDIIGRSIKWCQENITKNHPNFRFVHFNVKDQLHNPEGLFATTELSIPAEDKSIDRIILWSVVTHMFRPAIEHYFREFSRLLAPGGRVLATCFAVDEKILHQARQVNLTPWNLRFEHVLDEGCYINDLQFPTGAVAFDDKALARMVESSGLVFDRPILRGSWYGIPEQEDPPSTVKRRLQDVLILKRKDA